jgi:hypothetical protein
MFTFFPEITTIRDKIHPMVIVFSFWKVLEESCQRGTAFRLIARSDKKDAQELQLGSSL